MIIFNQSLFSNLSDWPDEPKLNIFDETDIIINKFWCHPKIIKLKQKFSIKKIVFKPLTEDR